MKQLTESQHKVFVGLAEGTEMTALSVLMGCSVKTVEYHRQAVWEALAEEGVRQGSISDLTHYAIANDVVVIKYSEMKLTYPRALKILGMVDFELKSDSDYARIMDVWRDKTVEAREAHNDVLAADLSQCKEVIKKKFNILKGKTCPRCQQMKHANSEYCSACALLLRGAEEKQPVNAQEEGLYTVVDDAYIMPKSNGVRGLNGVLTSSIRKLMKVGDSFITEKSPTSVKNAAKRVGVITICRKVNLGEKDKKKMRFRVWRTNGLKPSEVNASIKQRIDNAHSLAAAGQTAAEPTPEPPKAEDTD